MSKAEEIPTRKKTCLFIKGMDVNGKSFEIAEKQWKIKLNHRDNYYKTLS